jgi:hypothetical protein
VARSNAIDERGIPPDQPVTVLWSAASIDQIELSSSTTAEPSSATSGGYSRFQHA